MQHISGDDLWSTLANWLDGTNMVASGVKDQILKHAINDLMSFWDKITGSLGSL